MPNHLKELPNHLEDPFGPSKVAKSNFGRPFKSCQIILEVPNQIWTKWWGHSASEKEELESSSPYAKPKQNKLNKNNIILGLRRRKLTNRSKVMK